ncbi:MAG TPA: hypothetical protein VFR11_13895 [Micromonosporaceae bacterium]|nr:hypothetical protein [Micromonosporaceae bacterium]
MDVPVLILDGDCGFCTASVRFLARHVPTRATISRWQWTDLDAIGVTREAGGGRRSAG